MLTHALRSLQRTPGFTFTVIVTLALGIAAIGAMFAITYGVLLAPLRYGQPERLVSIALHGAEQRYLSQPPALHATWKRFAQGLDGLALYRTGNANLWMEGGDQAAERVTATWISGSMLPLLQVAPLFGRSFTEEEQLAEGPGAVILSEAEWRTRFHGAHDVLGKTVTINSVSRRIVGVMPAGFAFPTADTRVWLPVRVAADAVVRDFSYHSIGRLAGGLSAGQAQHELAMVLPQLAESFPRLDSGVATATWLREMQPVPAVTPLREAITGDIARTLWMLSAAGGLVLLVAWANVTNLMLLRADARRAELAVRETLGAGRLRLVTHFFGEALLLGGVAGLLALIAIHGAMRALLVFAPAGVPRLAELGMSPVVIGFVMLVTGASVLLCAMVPAMRLRRASLSSRMRDGARADTAGKSRQRLRGTIVALQIALALLVSVVSALLLRTAQNLRDVHPGFEPDQVTIVWTQLPFARYDEAAGIAFHARLTERVRALPSVQAAGVAARVPLDGTGEMTTQTIHRDGDSRTFMLPVHLIDDAYFDALRIPLLAGRGFRPLDEPQGGDIVISLRAAAALFGDVAASEVIGKSLALAPSGPSYTIVGVVGDVRDRDLTLPPVPMLYRANAVSRDAALEPPARRAMALLVRTSVHDDALVPAIRRIVRELDPTVPLFKVGTLREVMRASTARLSLALTVITAAALVTLLLGGIGLYGVMSTQVALRTREFGVRLALGADARRIARLVARRGLALTLVGVATGFALYAIVAPLLRGFLYDVTIADPATLLVAALVLIAIAAVASWLPARRAARIDPAAGLRAD